MVFKDIDRLLSIEKQGKRTGIYDLRERLYRSPYHRGRFLPYERTVKNEGRL